MPVLWGRSSIGVEQPTLNRQVAGPIPAAPTFRIIDPCVARRADYSCFYRSPKRTSPASFLYGTGLIPQRWVTVRACVYSGISSGVYSSVQRPSSAGHIARCARSRTGRDLAHYSRLGVERFLPVSPRGRGVQSFPRSTSILHPQEPLCRSPKSRSPATWGGCGELVPATLGHGAGACLARKCSPPVQRPSSARVADRISRQFHI